MIRPVNFLWKQLNGPQITAIVKSLQQWIVQQFDALLDYFNNLNIDRAGTYHLSLMGQIANLARPFVSIPDKNFFWFTAEPQKNFEHGYASLEDRGIGGKFIDLQALLDTYHGVPLTDEYFRILLKTYTNSEGEVGSLKLLDDIVYALMQKYGTNKTAYRLDILTENTGIKGNDCGDLYINLGREDSWNSWEQVVVSIKAIGNTLYAPLPRIFPEFTAEDPDPKA